MKIKLDENMPAELVDLLVADKHDVHTVPAERLVGRDDAIIFKAAVTEGCVLFT
jgi:predicted nuclease of predicted toxin-antitoxin system